MITHSFPKIFQLGTKPVLSIFSEEIEITEKMDGSQFAFGKINDRLHMRSKGAAIYPDSVQALFAPVVAYVLSIEKTLPNNIVFYGETLYRPKHNTLVYDNVPKHNFAMFGIHFIERDLWGNYEDMLDYANIFELDVVPLLFKGKIASDCTVMNMVNDFLDRESYLGGQKIEGVVIKNYDRQTNVANDIYTPFMSAKYVSEHFKEVHQNRWDKEEKPLGKWNQFCLQYRTPARWDKAVIHLREQGLLTDSNSDIGMLIKEVHKDISEEEKECIKEFLWTVYGKELLKVATTGLPEYYKQKLVKDTYEQD